jgi:hypothetical protein
LSTSARTEQRRPPPALLVGVALVGLALVGLALFLGRTEQEGSHPRRGAEADGTEPATLPKITHARWRVDKFPAGAVGGMTKAEVRRLKAQGPKVGRLVRSLYDTLFLEPERLGRVVRASFAGSAARSFLSLDSSGPPDRATRVKLVTRKARIGIDAQASKHAVASVTVAARGSASGRSFRLVHEATLWLERWRRGWRVIAYDLEQRPVRK